MRTRASFRLLIWLLLLITGGLSNVTAQDTSTITFPGLDGEVTVYFDAYGVPQIFATTPRDLFAAQGYVQAHQRWWQMEWLRRVGAGRLAELVGSEAVERDIFMRTMGIRRYAERDLDLLSESGREALEAYTRGVNHWLATAPPEAHAPEYEVLRARGNPLEAEAWTLIDSLTIQNLQAFSQNNTSMVVELLSGLLQAEYGEMVADLILLDYPYDAHPLNVEPGWQPVPNQSQPSGWGSLRAMNPDLEPLRLEITGSNAWAVSGSRSVTGLPLLANDSHMRTRQPALWYEIGLHCVEFSESCSYDVAGFGLPGAPGVIVGHNRSVAWGFTNAQTDMADFYRLELNPDNPRQYLYNDTFTDFEVLSESIDVFGADPVEVLIQVSVFGPVFQAFDVLTLPQPMALRWAAADGNRSLDAVLEMNRAANWDQFRAAYSNFDLPGLNVVYADREGHIAYLLSGRIPLRVEGHDGSTPVAGVNDQYQWRGYLEDEDHPTLLDPEVGYVVSANNAVIDPDEIDWTHATFFDYGYRAARLETLLQQTEQHSLESFAQIQLDGYNAAAALLLPVLQELEFEQETLEDMVGWLAEWDLQNTIDSPQAAFFNMFWLHLARLGMEELPIYEGSHSVYLMERMLDAPLHPLWTNSAEGLFGRDTVIITAFEQAYAQMVREYGSDRDLWAWGELHRARFEPELMTYLDDAVLEAQVVEVASSGGLSSPNATTYDPANNDFSVTSLPSMRMLIDLSNPDASLFVNSTGQSANWQDPHYGDQSALWSAGDYHAHLFSIQATESEAVTVWRLRP